jgi:hypothetical protein
VAGSARSNAVARGLGDDVTRWLWRRNVGRISPIMCTIVTGLTAFEGYHRMIHRRAGEADAWIRVAAVTIDFRATVNNRYVGTIRIIGYISHTRSACCMAAGRLTAARHAGVVEARGVGKRYRCMACTAVRARHDMVSRFA